MSVDAALVRRWVVQPLEDRDVAIAFSSQDLRTAVESGVGSCDPMLESQCSGVTGHEEKIPGPSPRRPISADSSTMWRSTSGHESNMLCAQDSAVRLPPRMITVLMGSPLLEEKERGLDIRECIACNGCIWVLLPLLEFLPIRARRRDI